MCRLVGIGQPEHRLQTQIEDYTKSRTKIAKKKLREILENKKDWYMTADEALELGVVDEILD